MKNFLVLYDISDNKIRNNVVKILKANGLYRIQKSVFLGACPPENMMELQKRFENYLTEQENDSYIILALDEYNIQKIKLLNIDLDIKKILGRKAVHFI